MKIEKIPNENITQFATELEKIIRASTNKKGFSFKLSVTSNKTAIIELNLSDIKGDASQKYMLIHDNLDGWVVYYNNLKITLDSLRELSSFNNKIQRKLRTIVRRF